MLAMLDQLVVSTALPRIVGDLGGVTHLSWVVTAYVLASTVTTPLYGKLGDLYGRKRLLMIAIVIFLVGSALSGLAHSMDQLIAFRALQGLGAGGLMVGAIATIGDLVSPARARPVHGLHHGRDDARHDRRAAGRRVHHRQLLLALDLLHQHADRRRPRWSTSPGRCTCRPARSSTRSTTPGPRLLAVAATAIVLVTTWGGTPVRVGSAQIIGLAVLAMAATVGVLLRSRRRPPSRSCRCTCSGTGTSPWSRPMSFLLGLAMFGAHDVPAAVPADRAARCRATASGLLLIPMMLGSR